MALVIGDFPEAEPEPEAGLPPGDELPGAIAMMHIAVSCGSGDGVRPGREQSSSTTLYGTHWRPPSARTL